MGSEPIDEVTDSCREALEKLGEVRSDVYLVAVHADWAFVSLGHFDPAQINDIFEPQPTLMLVRIPRDFPSGTAPYGLVAVPPLERSDGQSVRKQHIGHNNAKAVEDAFEGEEDVGFLSWNWDGASYDSPEDLKKAPSMVRKRFGIEG